MVNALIQGCRLIIHSDRKTLWGDLFKMDGSGPWVFVGVLNNRGKADWKRHQRTNAVERTLHVGTGSKYFESRGIVVIPEDPYVFLNIWAREYVAQEHPELANMQLPEHWQDVVAEAEEIIRGK